MMQKRVSVAVPQDNRPSSTGFRRRLDIKRKNSTAEQDQKALMAKEIDIAFDMLSSNKKTIGHNDIKAFIAKYFDNCPDEAMTILNNWKDDVTKDQLVSSLVHRNLLSTPYANALKFFTNEDTLSKKELKRFCARITEKGRIWKKDAQYLMDRLDLDGDGVIGVDDLKHISK